MEFTGERCIVGHVEKRIEEDHVNRNLFLKPYITKNHNVIDIACGTGFGTKIISQWTNNILGVDISTEAISYAKKVYHELNKKFTVGNAVNFSSPTKYDRVVSYETIEHISEYEKVIRNYNKLLITNGLLFISSPNRLITSPNCRELSDKPKNKFHTQEFTINELTNFVNNFGFQVTGTYFQRKQFKIRSRIIRYYSNQYLKLHERSSSKVVKASKFSLLHPRYFVLKAKKVLEL